MYEVIVMQTQVSKRDPNTHYGYTWSFAFYTSSDRNDYILECLTDTEEANKRNPEVQVLLSFVKNDAHIEASSNMLQFVIPPARF